MAAHTDHWRRNALHGTLVRRTNLSYAEEQPGSVGESGVFWSPDGRRLSYTIHGPSGAHCHVFIVPSDPTYSNTPQQFTWLPDTSDYDPTWSPLNTEIAFGRADYRIVRKGILGFSPEGSTRSGSSMRLTHRSNCRGAVSSFSQSRNSAMATLIC